MHFKAIGFNADDAVVLSRWLGRTHRFPVSSSIFARSRLRVGSSYRSHAHEGSSVYASPRGYFRLSNLTIPESRRTQHLNFGSRRYQVENVFVAEPSRLHHGLPFYPCQDIIVAQCRSFLLAVEWCFGGKCFRLTPRDWIGGCCGAAVSNCMEDLHDLLVADNLRMCETLSNM